MRHIQRLPYRVTIKIGNLTSVKVVKASSELEAAQEAIARYKSRLFALVPKVIKIVKAI